MAWTPPGDIVREFFSEATEIKVGGLSSPRKYTVTATNAETKEHLIYKVDTVLFRDMAKVMCLKPFPAQIRFRVESGMKLHLIAVYEGPRSTAIEIKPDY